MAIVTGITSARADQIEDATVTSAFLSPAGSLILKTDGGTETNLGPVTSPTTPIPVVTALVTVGAFDQPPDTVVVPEWYSPTTPNPQISYSNLPTGCLSADFSPEGKYLALAFGDTTSPYFRVDKRVDVNSYSALSPPGVLSASAMVVSWSPDGQYLAVGMKLTPFLNIYKRSGDVLTWQSRPATLPTGWVTGFSWSSDGSYLAIVHSTTPFVTIYSISGGVFTKVVNPSTLPPGQPNGVAFSPSGNHLVVAHVTTPFITMYSRLGDVFTKVANPAVLMSGTAYCVAWTSDGLYLAVGGGSTPFINVYKRSGDVLTKLTSPSPSFDAAGSVTNLKWSRDNQYLAAVHSGTPCMIMYKRYGDTLTKINNPNIAPTTNGRAVAWSPGGEHLMTGGDGTPYIQITKSTMGPIPGAATAVAVLP